jgi:hypothetical protein
VELARVKSQLACPELDHSPGIAGRPPCHPRGVDIMAAQTSRHQEDAMGEMKEFAGVYYREGALDPKTMQLVALAAMAAAGCTS